MFASTSNLQGNHEILSDNNHGSAAVTTAALGLGQGALNQTLPPMAAVAIQASTEHQDAQSRASPPPAAIMSSAAAEGLGNIGPEYTRANHGRARRAGSSDGRPRRPGSAASRHSDLGQGLDGRSRSPKSSEDTLVFSPELASAQAARRDGRARTSSGAKTRFIAASPPSRLVLRKAAPSPGGQPRQPSPWLFCWWSTKIGLLSAARDAVMLTWCRVQAGWKESTEGGHVPLF